MLAVTSTSLVRLQARHRSPIDGCTMPGNDVMDDPGHIEGVNTSTLMIVNVAVTDWGVYYCVADNIVNNATSNRATLHGECMYKVLVYSYIKVYLCKY